jgi:hypothetical protein
MADPLSAKRSSLTYQMVRAAQACCVDTVSDTASFAMSVVAELWSPRIARLPRPFG